MSKSRRKTQPGNVFSVADVMLRYMERGYWVCLDDKPLHPGWLGSMKLRTVERLLRGHRLRRCLSTEAVSRGATGFDQYYRTSLTPSADDLS